jgi:uncharacterized DUF497 family protein
MQIRFTWREPKRRTNLSDHGLDFMDVPAVFDGSTYTYEDDRFPYGEQRFVTLGMHPSGPVSIVHTETDDAIHIISFRKATARETALLFAALHDRT